MQGVRPDGAHIVTKMFPSFIAKTAPKNCTPNANNAFSGCALIFISPKGPNVLFFLVKQPKCGHQTGLMAHIYMCYDKDVHINIIEIDR